MAFFTVDTSEDQIKDYQSSGSFLNKSGMYDILLKNVIVDTTAKGSEYLNFLVEYNNISQMLYQAIRLTNNDGRPNLGVKLFNKLCVVAGLKEGEDIPDPVTKMLPIGKEEKECRVLEVFDGIPLTIRLQIEYSLYNGNVQQSKNIMNIFRYTDKATASEIINHSENMGHQYSIESQYADKIIYKDDLTEKDVEEWFKNKRKESNSSTPAKKPATGFTRKFSRN